MKDLPRTALSVALLAAALLLACGGDDETTTPDQLPPIAPTSPANVLRNVERSFNTKDYDLFEFCLSPNFVFYFNPNDIGEIVEGYVIPVSWNRVEMEAAIQHMFNEAYRITLSIPTSGMGTPGSGATTWRAEGVNIRLELLTSPGNGYRIGAGFCNFEFEKYENNGAYRWRLTKWWDYTRGLRATTAGLSRAPYSLGSILALYN